MTFNMVAPLECPACGEYDRYGAHARGCVRGYESGCICPMCCPKPDEDQLANDLVAWQALAPVMLALNAAEFEWVWNGTQVDEIMHPRSEHDDHYFTVFMRGDVFVAVHMGVVSARTYDHPEEWDEIESGEFADVQGVIDWLEAHA